MAAPTGYTCPATGCHSITVTGSTFKDFGYLKNVLMSPIAVDPTKGMHYVGQVIDLDNYPGPVKLQENLFFNIGIKYNNCSMAQDFILRDPATFSDRYPSYGPKTKY